MPTRAWIGEPHDGNGIAIPCSYCYRRATIATRVEGAIRPVCMRHAFPRERQNMAQASRRARQRRRV